MTHPPYSTNPNKLEPAAWVAFIARYRDWPEDSSTMASRTDEITRSNIAPAFQHLNPTASLGPGIRLGEHYRDWPDDDDDHIIVVPPCGPDNCIVELPDGRRFWVSLPPEVRAQLPHAARLEDAHKLPRLTFSGAAKQRSRRQRKLSPPDGLLTRAQAATKLNCSLRTFDGHVASGALRYVAIGHGLKRPRKMFTDVDLNEFIANQTRKDVPCPSTASRARRSGTSTSGGEVIAFTGLRRPRRGAKPRK